MPARTVVIMGAAGRDFHNFNCVFREDPGVRVAAFTATQIPDIAGRMYPPDLAGKLYPDGIPIVAESELEGLFALQKIDEVVFSYSDVSHQHVMEQASRVIALGADFRSAGRCPHDAEVTPARRGGLRGAHGKRQEPDHAAGGGNTQEDGKETGGDPPPDAVRESLRAESAALRDDR